MLLFLFMILLHTYIVSLFPFNSSSSWRTRCFSQKKCEQNDEQYRYDARKRARAPLPHFFPLSGILVSFYFSFTTSWICAICDGSHIHKFSWSAIIRHHLYNEFIFTFTSSTIPQYICENYSKMFRLKFSLRFDVVHSLFHIPKAAKMWSEQSEDERKVVCSLICSCAYYTRLFAMCRLLLLEHKPINSTWFGHWNSISNRIHYGQSCSAFSIVFVFSCSAASHSF